METSELLRETRDAVIRIDEKMSFLIDAAHDHEMRLRSLEEGWRKWRYSIPAGLLTAVGGLVAALAALLGANPHG